MVEKQPLLKNDIQKKAKPPDQKAHAEGGYSYQELARHSGLRLTRTGRPVRTTRVQNLDLTPNSRQPPFSNQADPLNPNDLVSMSWNRALRANRSR